MIERPDGVRGHASEGRDVRLDRFRQGRFLEAWQLVIKVRPGDTLLLVLVAVVVWTGKRDCGCRL